MAYNKLIDLNLLSNFLNKIKSLIPTKTSDLENDSEYITGMEILSYGNSTWNDFLTAYTAKKVVYCRASSNSNPASGSQTRLAFMAYVNNADNPTNVEFQYYRSVSSHTNTQQGDQVFVYKLDKTSGWSVTTREASSKIVAGTNMTSSYSSDTLTLNANIPSNVSDLTNDSGYITGITSSDVTTALGYTPSSTDTTYSAGNGIDITNTIIKNTQGIEYIVGTQITSTAAWTGNSTDEALYTGKIIAYYLPFAGTSTAATLTLTMANGATTEAIPLRRVASSTVTTQFAAGNIIVLIYDGTYWRVSAYHNSSDTNTIPTGYCTTGASTAAKSANCTYGYRDDANYFPCLFRYANTAENATLAIASYATTALPIYVNGARTSATNTFGAGVILFLYYNGAYYCYNDGRLPILVNGVVTSVQDYTNELKNTINEISQVITSTNIDSTSIVTFDASAADMPLKGLMVDIEPVQDLHGYDHPWPEGGGKNKIPLTLTNLKARNTSGTWDENTYTINGITFTVSANEDAVTAITADGTNATTNWVSFYIPVTGLINGGSYVLNGTPTGGSSSKYRETLLSYGYDYGSSYSFTKNKDGNDTLSIDIAKEFTAQNIVFYPMIRLASVTDATFEPYSNICPITGWTGCNVTRTGKNLFNIPSGTLKVGTINKDTGVIDTSASTSRYTENMLKIKGGANYAFQWVFSSSPQATLYMAYYDSNGMFLERVVLIPAVQAVAGAWSGVVQMRDDASYIRLCGYVGVFSNSSNQQIEEGNEITDYEPYKGDTYDITFPTEAGTVYGGTLDVVNGVLTVDRASIVVSDATIEKRSTNFANWRIVIPTDRGAKNNRTEVMVFSSNYKGVSYDGATSDADNYAFVQNAMYIGIKHTATAGLSLEEYKSQYGDVRFVYYLDTPITYHLTPQEITTLLGTNNIWADTDDISVTYGAYLETVKAYIDQSIAEQDLINDAQDERIADLEQTTTAIAINPSAIATFKASTANMPLKGLTINIEPVQDFNGYDSPWPGGSRKNLLNIDDLIAAPSGTFGGYTFKHKLTLIVSPNTQYTLSTSYNDTGNVLYFNGTSGSGNCVKADAPKTFQSSETGELTILLYDRDGISSFENKTVTVQLEEGSTATTYEPYSNICPISGWTGCKLFYPDLDITRNLSIVENKYINTSGVEADSIADFSHTNYFPVTPGETLYFSSYWDELPASAPSIAFYNADKTFVSPRKSFVTANDGKGVVGYNFETLTVPDNCYYAIFNFNYSTRNRIVLTKKNPTITFPSTLGTVYGGTFDVANKKLIIDKAEHIFTGTETFKTDIVQGIGYITDPQSAHNGTGGSTTVPFLMCSHLNPSLSYLYSDNVDRTNKVWPWFNSSKLYILLGYASGVTSAAEYISYLQQQYAAGTPVTVCYSLNTPIVYDLTADQITTIFGENNIWADCGDVTVIYGEYLTQIKNNINNLDKRVKIIEDDDPLFDKLIHLPDDDSFFDKQGITTLGTYTKIDKHTFKISGGSGTAYYSYPLHGTNKVIWGTNTQMLTRLTPSDFAPIPASGSWGNTTYSVGMRVYSETNTTNSNRNLEIDLWAANIQNDEFIGEPIVVASCIPTNYTKYCTTILKLRGTGFGPLSQYTHYAIFARSRSRASSAEAIIRLETVQSPRLMQYILYPTSAIETSLTATTSHAPNTFILNNDRLYKVLTQIQTGEEIVVGTNVTQVSILEALTSLLNNTENIPNTSSISNTGLISIKHDSTELFTIQLPLYNGGVSNGT